MQNYNIMPEQYKQPFQTLHNHNNNNNHLNY